MKAIKATPNYSKKTFTIRTFIDGKLFAKYRTLPMLKEEFNDAEFNTENDWKQFLTTNNYINI